MEHKPLLIFEKVESRVEQFSHEAILPKSGIVSLVSR